MKKIFISLSLAFAALTVNAQSVVVSTYQGTDMAQYAGQVKNVKTYRQMFTGWNTVSLPYSMTEEQVNEAFGSDCKLEQLAGVSQNGSTIYLNFADAKAQGIKANTPYILYFGGENKMVSICLKGVELENAPSKVAFNTSTGVAVTFNGVQTMTDGSGLYGIRVINNKEANFVDVTEIGSKFFATRCYIAVEGISNPALVATHNAVAAAKGALTGVEATAADAQSDGKVYDLSGRQTTKNAKGIKIIDGKKIF